VDIFCLQPSWGIVFGKRPPAPAHPPAGSHTHSLQGTTRRVASRATREARALRGAFTLRRRPRINPTARKGVEGTPFVLHPLEKNILRGFTVRSAGHAPRS
jgi:hypothetical protein